MPDNNNDLTLSAPLSGPVLTLGNVPDDVFASGAMGDGIAIDPLNDCLHAPCAGVVIHVARTGHALTIRADNGAEVLLHVGIDTVQLNGEGFALLVKQGARVSNGQPLVRFDLDRIARQCKIGPMGYLAGVFFETGLSRFHSEYEPDDSRSIDSEGHDYYYGVGALAKVFLNRDHLKGLYAEGSIRYGLMMGDWQSHDIQSDGQTADWDGRAPYLTAHGGLGYLWNVTDNVTADVYAKYFWGHL